ncbi:HD domain-containing protein [Candidatus Woesearchaeota archaeon]|nr:HD domain-containing protein [Candidatus Woesearchaeota archaeon]
MRSPEVDKQIEEAIKFLVFVIHKSGKNPKPVILHSIRVGLNLYILGYDKDIVIAAILHDVIEDTNTKIEEVKSKFGSKVAKLVEANSFDDSIADRTERYKENFERCRKAGKDALIIKAADFFDNADYYNLASTNELANWLLEKLKYFIDNSKKELKDEALYREVVKKYMGIAKT